MYIYIRVAQTQILIHKTLTNAILSKPEFASMSDDIALSN